MDDGKRLDSLSRAGRCMAIKNDISEEGVWGRGCQTAPPQPPWRILGSAIGILFLCYVLWKCFFDALGGHVGPFEHPWVPKASIWDAKRCRQSIKKTMFCKTRESSFRVVNTILFLGSDPPKKY